MYDHFETTTVNIDGTKSDTISDIATGGRSPEKFITTTSADGLSKTIQIDWNGDGVIDHTQIDTTIFNADGSQKSVLSDFGINGALLDRTITTTSANGMRVDSLIDTNGDGTDDEEQLSLTNLMSDGSRTQVKTDSYIGIQGIRDSTTTTTSADGHMIVSSIDSNGDNSPDREIDTKTNLDGSQSQLATYFTNQSSTVNVSASFDGRTTTITNSNGTVDTTSFIAAGDSKSYSWTEVATVVNHSVGESAPIYFWAPAAQVHPAVVAFSTHFVDENGIDTWSWNETPTKYVEHLVYSDIPVNNVKPLFINWYDAIDSTTTHSIQIDQATENSDVQMAARIYDVVLDRDMSASETQMLAKYIDSLSKNVNETQIATDILASTEFSKKYGGLSNAQFIQQMFQNSLGRAPTLAEFLSLFSQLGNNTITRAGLIVYLADSAEHLADGNGHAVTNNTAIGNASPTLDHTLDKAATGNVVSRLYAAGLSRAPSLTELSNATQAVTSGTKTESQLAADIVGNMIAQYGTPTGGVGGGHLALAISDFVTILFQNALGRTPAPTEAQFWVNALNAGTLSEADALIAIADSEDHLVYGKSSSISLSAAIFAQDQSAGEAVGTVVISDLAANIVSNLPALQSGVSNISSIVASDNQQVVVGNGLFVSSRQALDKVVGGFTILGQASVLSGNLDGLQNDIGRINSITGLNGTITGTVANFLRDQVALDKVVGGFNISDTAATIVNNIAALQNDASHIDAIAASDGQPIVVGNGKFVADRTALDKIVGGFTILGDASVLSGNLDGLQDDVGHINSVTANAGSGTITGTVANFTRDKALLDKVVGGFNVSDASATVSSALDALQADVSHINAVGLTNANPVISATAAQATADAGILAKISSPYVLDVTNPNGSMTITGHGNGLQIHDVGTSSTLTGGGSSETFVFDPGFGSATITDFGSHLTGTGYDSISVASSDFANWSTLLSDAHSTNGGADTTFTSTTTGASLTLAGVTLTNFQNAGVSSHFTFR